MTTHQETPTASRRPRLTTAYEGNTEAVDELREVLGLLEAEFTSLIYTPDTDDDA
jgi:hypothetical protein